MVELALRALFGPCSRFLVIQWNGSQQSLSRGELLDKKREPYIRGCFSFWKNVLERLCSGCMTEDSNDIFCRWLGDYKKHLSEVVNDESLESDKESKKMYVQGQVDSFNAYLASLSKLSGGNKIYDAKLASIAEKQKELETLYEDLESLVWQLDKEEDVDAVSSMSE